MSTSEFFIDRSCPPYRHIDRENEDTQYQAELVYRGNRVIGVRSEQRGTFKRNCQALLLRFRRYWK